MVQLIISSESHGQLILNCVSISYNVFHYLFKNPLKLAHAIVRCDFAEINSLYSADLHRLVNNLLNKV